MNNTIVTNLKKEFIKRFEREPLLIASPGRINLIGEHTDYNDGFVMPASIDKKVYCAIAKNNTINNCTIHSLSLKDSFGFELGQIEKNTSKNWINYVVGVVDIINKDHHLDAGFDILVDSDLPLGAGLSSSAALENAIAFGINDLFELNIPKEELIYISQKAEHVYAEVECGIMDQYSSVFGKKKNLLLLDCQTITSKEIPAKFEPYELWLLNTNVSHNLADSEYNKRREECREAIRLINEHYRAVSSFRDLQPEEISKLKEILPEILFKRTSYVIEENDRVQKAAEALKNDDLVLFGKMLYLAHEGQQLKYEVSCKELDFLVDFSKKFTEVLGSRMMGGGFGGCTINLIHKDIAASYVSEVAEAYQKEFNIALTPLKVSIDNGTHILKNENINL
ncbi:galactokinase [Zhouia spongiae]|uniref:Galactokinase n=1 Tax=Zhouia spongiae TaxID=2202721 RepID=A0ABY3YIS3_9FLAO|nr:galactokinase [Zhouia spongiae]UNY97729.1 galactokinase [Zhouia spongiae]